MAVAETPFVQRLRVDQHRYAVATKPPSVVTVNYPKAEVRVDLLPDETVFEAGLPLGEPVFTEQFLLKEERSYPSPEEIGRFASKAVTVYLNRATE